MEKDDTSFDTWDKRYEEKKKLIVLFAQYKELGFTPVNENMSNFQAVETGKLNALGNLNHLGSQVYRLQKEVETVKWGILKTLCDDHPNEIVDLSNPPTWILLDKEWARCTRMLADLEHLQDLIEDTRTAIQNRSYELDRLLKYHKYRHDAIFG